MNRVATLYAGKGAELYHRLTTDDVTELPQLLRWVHAGDRVLELACGSGRITVPLLRRGADVTAVDLSTDLLTILQNRAQATDALHCVHADILTWEPRAPRFDSVILGTASICLFDAPERTEILRRARRWVRPDGHLLLSIRNKDAPVDEVVENCLDDGTCVRVVVDAAARTSTTTLRLPGDAGGHEVTSRLVSVPTITAELETAGFRVVRTDQLRGGDLTGRVEHVVLACEPVCDPVPSPCFEFFRPVSDWGRIEAVSAQGRRVDFADGVSAVCGISGLWNASLGYGNEAIAAAVDAANREQSALPLFRRGSRIARQASQALLDLAGSPFAAVLYSTSGSSALDATVKLCRQAAKMIGGERKRRVVSLVNSYHGMTQTAMALTGENVGQDIYDVDRRLHLYVCHDDVVGLRRIMGRFGDEIAAVVVEPVQGSGAVEVPPEMVAELTRARARHDFILVADEVATGFWRTGVAFASSRWPARDVMVLSKALTNGACAASAILVADWIVDLFAREGATLWHGETQGGAPQSCAAIVATLREHERLDTASLAPALGDKLRAGLESLVRPGWSVQGVGAMQALRISRGDGADLTADEVVALAEDCRRAGALVQPAPSALQLLPAFTITDEELGELLGRMAGVLDDWFGGRQ